MIFVTPQRLLASETHKLVPLAKLLWNNLWIGEVISLGRSSNAQQLVYCWSSSQHTLIPALTRKAAQIKISLQVQWITPKSDLPHGFWVQISAPGFLCGILPLLAGVFSLYCGFLPHSKIVHVWFIEDSKLSLGAYVIYMWWVVAWQPVQGVPHLSPLVSWMDGSIDQSKRMNGWNIGPCPFKRVPHRCHLWSKAKKDFNWDLTWLSVVILSQSVGAVWHEGAARENEDCYVSISF